MIVVYDVTTRRTFTNLEAWLRMVDMSEASDGKLVYILVGNKTDLQKERQVAKEEGKLFAGNNIDTDIK